MADGEAGPGSTGRKATVALILGVAAVIVSWVPILGLALGAAGLALAVQARRAARRSGALGDPVRTRLRRALGVAGFGFLLGLGFTVAWRACTPSVETPAEKEDWDTFEKAFEVPGGGGGGTGAPAPSGPREPAAPPPARPVKP